MTLTPTAPHHMLTEPPCSPSLLTETPFRSLSPQLLVRMKAFVLSGANLAMIDVDAALKQLNKAKTLTVLILYTYTSYLHFILTRYLRDSRRTDYD